MPTQDHESPYSSHVYLTSLTHSILHVLPGLGLHQVLVEGQSPLGFWVNTLAERIPHSHDTKISKLHEERFTWGVLCLGRSSQGPNPLRVPFDPSTCKTINSRNHSSIWTKHHIEINFIAY